MTLGYGLIEPDESIELVINQWSIKVTVSKNGTVEYVRRTNRKMNTEIISGERRARIVGLDKLILQPIYPVLIPKRLTTYILVKYNDVVMIAPGGRLEYYILMPVDIAILSVRNQSYSLIDVFNVGKVKYTLYGSVESGVIARYAESKIYFGEEDALDDLNIGLALVKIRASNKSREWVTLTKILLEANPLKLYYEENTWRAYSRLINININSPRTATVTYSSSPKPGLMEVIDPPELKVPFMAQKTSMLWGL